jgi:hypothetical protein
MLKNLKGNLFFSEQSLLPSNSLLLIGSSMAISKEERGLHADIEWRIKVRLGVLRGRKKKRERHNL